VFEVLRPPAVEATAQQPAAGERRPEDTTRELKVGRAQLEESSLPELAPLPPSKRYSLAVILGANAGQIFPVTRPRVVLGRGVNCDIQLQDSEVSRRHAMLEIKGDTATITDLGSTNGTFVDGIRVSTRPIEAHQEFCLGTTTLMFIVTEMSDSS
jgi:pSer/pThr/pTyr-binding forkhead associated (FHA) protein